FAHHKIPQIGKVVIEDHCDLGSHCSVDRATLTETRIKAGSKLDNFCHIAHNCEIGENSMLAAGFMTAGSTIMGKNMMTGGGVHLNGHIKIADNVIFAGNTGVVSDVDAPGVYGGFPQVPQKENLRIMSSLAFLPKLRRQVSQIFKHLGLEEK
ncbi:MAG: UDP-3-O-(3-hydroxymyristoyl)glucosamine N-acyltransferase, partial [Moraxellaceae bacterium]|nr:UDP-3-O-(3-hydroxymyristoyl)glucosamine N-acyltransferase [Pseudobdellovibrionaceae bacterium]